MSSSPVPIPIPTTRSSGGDLSVTGNATVSRNLTVSQNLMVDQNASLKKELTVTGNTTVSKNLTVSQNLTVDQNASLKGELTVSGNTTVSKNLTVTQNLTVDQNASIAGELAVTGNTTVTKNLTVSQNISVTQNASIAGELAVSGNTTVTKNLTVSQNISVTQNASIGGELKVTGNANIVGNLTLDGSLNINGNINAINKVVETLYIQDAYIKLAPNTTGGTGSQVETGIYTLLDGNKGSGLIRTAGNDSSWFLSDFSILPNGSHQYLSRGNLTLNNLAVGGSALVTETLHVGDLNIASDRRLKTDINIIENALEKIDKLNGVTYIWKDGHGKKEIGVIAQDIQAQFPEIVNASKEFLGVDYTRLPAVLIEGVKELSKENRELRNMIKDIYEKLEQNKCKCEKMDVAEEVVVTEKVAVAEEAPKRRGRKSKETSSPSSTSSLTSSDSDETPKRRGRKPKVVVE